MAFILNLTENLKSERKSAMYKIGNCIGYPKCYLHQESTRVITYKYSMQSLKNHEILS